MSIPQHVKASLGLSRHAHYAGAVDTELLARLQPELAQTGQPLQVELGLERDAVGQWLRGSVRGELWLTCRRCLGGFEWPVDLAIDLRLVQSEDEEQQVLQDSDPYRVEDDRLPLLEIVEDEMLLALPMMPRCGNCAETVSAAAEPVAEEAVERRPNPFAELLKPELLKR
jgi:uncharacterized protein